MTNSTETYWDVDGQSLQTFAFNIQTLGGDRLAPPPYRGQDLAIPSTPGRRWMPKVVDSRVITLGMWVIGADEAGNVPADTTARRQFDENWRKLRNLLWTYDREVTLTKRFWVDGVLVTAAAKAQFAGGLLPSMGGPARAAFTVDLRLADPYFYGTEIVLPLTSTQTVDVAGDDVTRAIEFEINGARTNVIVRNDTMDLQFQHSSVLPSGDTIDINVLNYTAVTDPAATPSFDSVSEIIHEGSPSWFLLKPGDNLVEVSSSFGIGTVVMKYKPVWL